LPALSMRGTGGNPPGLLDYRTHRRTESRAVRDGGLRKVSKGGSGRAVTRRPVPAGYTLLGRRMLNPRLGRALGQQRIWDFCRVVESKLLAVAWVSTNRCSSSRRTRCHAMGTGTGIIDAHHTQLMRLAELTRQRCRSRCKHRTAVVRAGGVSQSRRRRDRDGPTQHRGRKSLLGR